MGLASVAHVITCQEQTQFKQSLLLNFFLFSLLLLTIVMVFNAILGLLLKAATNWIVELLNRNFQTEYGRI